MKVMHFFMLIFLWLGLLLVASSQLQGAPLPVMLKTDIQVNDEYVRLKDIFEPLGQDVDENKVLIKAPPPGKVRHLYASWLHHVAVQMGLSWHPMSENEKITIRRQSDVLDEKKVMEKIKQAFEEKGLDMSVRLFLFAQHLFPLHIPKGQFENIRIEEFSVDVEKKRFQGYLVFGNSQQDVHMIKGRYDVLKKVVALKKYLPKGQMLTSDHLIYTHVPEKINSLPMGMTIDQFVGKTLKRSLKKGFVLRESDVGEPVLVQRGQMVKVILRQGNMELILHGKAMENGSRRQVIRIKNFESGKILNGQVFDENYVILQGRSAVMNSYYGAKR